MIVSPGLINPCRSASSISDSAVRSLIEPVGLADSILARIRTSGLGVMRDSSTSGVLPIVATRSGETACGGGERAHGGLDLAPPAIAGRIVSVSASRDRRVEPAQHSDVFVVEVQVDEAVELSRRCSSSCARMSGCWA